MPTRPPRLAADLLVLADYGRLLPAAVVDAPRHGALNLHPSLLPRWRGATPVARAIAAGDAITGVSLMRMDAGLDTGPLVAQRETAIAPDETTPDLEARLATMAAALLLDRLGPWLRGEAAARPQPGVGVSVARQFRRVDGRIDVGASGRRAGAAGPRVPALARLVRGHARRPPHALAGPS